MQVKFLKIWATIAQQQWGVWNKDLSLTAVLVLAAGEFA